MRQTVRRRDVPAFAVPTNLSFETKVLADLGCDADWIRGFPAKWGRVWHNIPRTCIEM